MKNLAIIPARSGSKGLVDKNIKMLDGKPLLAYTISAAKESKLFDKIMVSTDSEKYADIAKENGAEVPFLRTKELSGDKAGSWDVVKAVLEEYKNRGEVFETVCLLQPTSPLRTHMDIIESYSVLKERMADSVTAVCECDHSPLWAMNLDESLSMREFRKKFTEAPRQALDKYYRINGAIYIKTIIYEENTIILRDSEEYAYIMDAERSVDIDTQFDFTIAEAIIKNKKNGGQ